MSKISEYLDAVRDYYARQEMERKTRQSTVAGYAQEMGMPVDRLIRQLADVGFTKSEHDALDQSERFHKDERHIMRMVKAHTEEVGATFERRQMWRRWAEAMRSVYSAEGNREPKPSVYETILDGLKLPPELESQEFEDEDYLDHLDELIRKEADAKPLVTRKIRVLRSVTQRD